MNRKHFTWLLFATFIVAGLLLMLPDESGRDGGLENTLLVPGFQSQVNDVAWVRLTGAGAVTIATLERAKGHWTVEEASGYRADFDKLKTLLTDLAQATVVEEKTANPDYYDRLGVEDISAADAGGVLIEFDGASNLPGIIVGNTAQGREGQYVRLRDSQESVLIDRQLSLPVDQADWLDKNIIDIPDTEVVEFEIRHPDGEQLLARKASADQENFSLEGIPEGHAIKSAWTVNSIAGNLAGLNLDSVAPAASIDWTGATTFRLLAANGLQTDVELVAKPAGVEETAADEEFWIRLQASTYTTALESGVETVADASETVLRAQKINERTAGWAYRIPKYKYDSMTNRKEDLLDSEQASG